MRDGVPRAQTMCRKVCGNTPLQCWRPGALRHAKERMGVCASMRCDEEGPNIAPAHPSSCEQQHLRPSQQTPKLGSARMQAWQNKVL
jgi:hypothetical protein